MATATIPHRNVGVPMVSVFRFDDLYCRRVADYSASCGGLTVKYLPFLLLIVVGMYIGVKYPFIPAKIGIS